MSSTWMRQNTWPGLTIRRAVPSRRVASALRPGPGRRCRRGGRCGPAGRSPARRPRRAARRRGARQGGRDRRRPRRPSRRRDRHRRRWCRDSPPRRAAGAPEVARVVVEHRIARLVGGDRGEQMGDAGERLLGLLERPVAREAPDLDARLRQARLLVRIARRAGDLPAFAGQLPRQSERRVAESEAEQASHDARLPFAAHSRVRLARRMRCGTGGQARRARAAGRAPRPPSRGPAATGRQAARSATAARAGSPLLPIAISTLRTKRSRPMRLTGEPAKRAPEGRIVEPGELGQRRCAQVVARLQLRLARGARELVPGADREAVVAAIDPVADRARETRARSGPCARW